MQQSQAQPRWRWRSARWSGIRIDWSAYLFVLPLIVPFLLFTVGPIIFGAFVAFTNWSIIRAPEWVGLKNFENALAEPLVRTAFLNTIRYGLIVVPGVTILGFTFAMFVNQRWPGYLFARAAFFAPYVVSATVIGLVWVWMLDTQFGIINQYLGLRIPWLTNPDWSLYGVSVATLWWDVGLAFVLFLSGLQGIESEVIESGRVDGAGKVQLLRYIILPLMRPTLSLVITLQTINTIRIFSQISVMTNGGPGASSMSAMVYIYNFGIGELKLGYAAAIGLLLFGLTIVATIVNRIFVREGTD